MRAPPLITVCPHQLLTEIPSCEAGYRCARPTFSQIILFGLQRADMQDVRRERRGSSFMRRHTISAMSMHAGDAGADQGLVADEPEEKLIKIGAKVVHHGRYVAFQMAEVAIPRQMFQEILWLIAELPPQPPPAPA